VRDVDETVKDLALDVRPSETSRFVLRGETSAVDQFLDFLGDNPFVDK
jgi:hypothetical protein